MSSDADFKVLGDGSVYTAHDLVLPPPGKTFSLFLADPQQRVQKEMEIVLEARGQKVQQAEGWPRIDLLT